MSNWLLQLAGRVGYWWRSQKVANWVVPLVGLALLVTAVVLLVGGLQTGSEPASHPSSPVTAPNHPARGPGQSEGSSGAPRHHPPNAYSHNGVIVQKGDSLWSISHSTRAHPFRWEHLARVNHIRTPYLIYPGQVLRA